MASLVKTVLSISDAGVVSVFTGESEGAESAGNQHYFTGRLFLPGDYVG